MSREKIIFAATSLGFAGFGIALLIFPNLMGMVGVNELSNSGTVEVRAFYGGLELGIALFFLLAINRPKWLQAALVLEVCLFGGLVIGRILGLMVIGWRAHLIIYLILVAEGILAVMGAVALSKFRSGKPMIDEK